MTSKTSPMSRFRCTVATELGNSQGERLASEENELDCCGCHERVGTTDNGRCVHF